MYIENVEDPVEVHPPGGECFFIILRVGDSGEQVPCTLFSDPLLDLRYSPAIESVMSESYTMCIADRTHAVSCSIASETERLSSSACLPFIPRSRALHTSAQASPRST